MEKRVIKFKAFIPAIGIMLEEVTPYPGVIGLYEDQLRELVEAKGLILDDDCIRRRTEDEDEHLMNVLQGDEWYWIEEPNYHLLQFTGLHDKSGKEIYEFDIVKDSAFTWLVRFGECMVDGNYFVGWYLEHPERQDFDGPFTSLDKNQLEVIGNIYEQEKLSTLQ